MGSPGVLRRDCPVFRKCIFMDKFFGYIYSDEEGNWMFSGEVISFQNVTLFDGQEKYNTKEDAHDGMKKFCNNNGYELLLK